MPIYTWQCQKCAQVAEIFNRMADFDKPPEPCECGGEWQKQLDVSVSRWRYVDQAAPTKKR